MSIMSATMQKTAGASFVYECACVRRLTTCDFILNLRKQTDTQTHTHQTHAHSGTYTPICVCVRLVVEPRRTLVFRMCFSHSIREYACAVLSVHYSNKLPTRCLPSRPPFVRTRAHSPIRTHTHTGASAFSTPHDQLG